MFTYARPRVGIVLLAAVVALPLGVTTLATASGAETADSDIPTIRLIGTRDHITLMQTRRGDVWLEPGVYVASDGGAFELWAGRSSYRDPIAVSQVVRDSTGAVVQQRAFPDITIDELSNGLPHFSRLTLLDSAGERVIQRQFDYCPNQAQAQRVDDTGPDNPTYPEICWTNPFTTGMVWGIDQGWATGTGQYLYLDDPLPDGQYQLKVALTRLYREQFAVPSADATITIDVDIVTQTSRGTLQRRGAVSAEPSTQRSLTTARSRVPGPAARPDVAALPAWGMSVQNRRRDDRSFLRFGATVWNRGPSPLVVEGFREAGAETMKAYQYFYREGVRVGKVFSGRLEYDHQDGHDHWHFRDFANYSLLDTSKAQVVRSGKEAFCLAPTDLIDVTVPHANMKPWLAGLGTACGDVGALWIREVLQTGWGDTYTQYRPGQSFDITNLPNGRYFVEVRANPDGRLYEVTDTNNVALRRIYLRGPVGDRQVVVPPYQGIDTENGGGCGPFC